MKKISGNKLLVKALKEEGVDTLFGYPGACTIDISDELYKQDYTKVILPRQEVALVHEADAYARSTGKVGVCLVTSGPGATNLVTGLATAYYDSVPLVCFTGQVARHLIGNDAFQEVDIVGITRSITKYGVTVRNREDLGRIVKEAFYIARTGRPGPVLIDLPKDVMGELGSAEYPKEVNIRGYKPNTSVHIGQLKRAIKMLNKAERPLFLAGGGVNIAHANKEFTELVEKTNVPVITTVMGRGAIPTNHPLFIGNLGMHGAYAANMSVGECDLLFSIGTRFNDRITGKLHSFAPKAQIVHIDIDTAAISKNVQVDVPIVADAKEAVTKMLEYVEVCDTKNWLSKIAAWKAEHPMVMKKKPIMTPQDIIDAINESFEKAIVVTDVGQHQMFTAQFLELDENKKLLMSGGLGTMGYGLPGAIGAQIGNPDTPVISISGDGGMQMNIQELATAVLEELPIISCIFNNSNLGMVRQWQKLFYGKRYSMTCLRSGAACRGKCGEVPCPEYTPDFVKLAESYGAKGIRVTKKEEILPAFEEARKSKKVPTIIEFTIDPEDLVYPMIQPGGTLEDMILDC
ncbi:biosynthetic-type acetolactate synthase large subunit [Dorea acetigenes]|uniref:Acetolactate synthase n=1 Tax=Dorea acetigenes TaxID=2981787 RepID=A0ABT2RJ82_9FIRM|nr:biosynthetic-type acetolactate synthase large subunit [Dorea acetigenes]MCU6685396.1 biosynthetic-type acetolactate synthase large subunit [Dorea acetigenes]SCI46109.1 Acetolactate synthase large subunit [uncultured Clostridium sp.]